MAMMKPLLVLFQLVMILTIFPRYIVLTDQYLIELVKLNKLTRNSSILELKQTRQASYSIGSVSFKFGHELIELLARINSSHVELKLVNFTSTKMPIFRTQLPLFRVLNHSM